MIEEKTNLPDIEPVEKPRNKKVGKPRGPASDKVKANLEKGRLKRMMNIEKKQRAKQHAANLMREMKMTLLSLQEEMRQKRMKAIHEKPAEIAPVDSADEPQTERGFGKIIGSGGLVLRPH